MIVKSTKCGDVKAGDLFVLADVKDWCLVIDVWPDLEVTEQPSVRIRFSWKDEAIKTTSAPNHHAFIHEPFYMVRPKE